MLRQVKTLLVNTGIMVESRGKACVYVVFEGQPWLMFNLNEDPYELANLAHNTRYRIERRRLQDRLAQWINDTGDEFALPRI